MRMPLFTEIESGDSLRDFLRTANADNSYNRQLSFGNGRGGGSSIEDHRRSEAMAMNHNIINK